MSAVNEILAQINAGNAKRTSAIAKKKEEKKPTTKPRAGSSGASPSSAAPSSSHGDLSLSAAASASLGPANAATTAVGPPASATTAGPGGRSVPAASGIKMKLKGSTHGFTSAARPSALVSGPAPRAKPSSTPSYATAGAASTSAAAASSMPLNKRLKDVQDFLRDNVGESFTVAQIRAGTQTPGCPAGHDLHSDAELLQRLRNAALVHVEDDPEDPLALRLRYRPKHEGVRDKTTLLNFVRDNPSGTYREALEDCYKGVGDDISALQAERKVFVISDPELNQEALFPAELLGVKVDDDIVAQFHEVQLPYDVLELQASVIKAGLRSALASQELKRPPPAAAGLGKDGKRKRPRKERAININKATNAHLPSLFAGAAPKNIDER